MQKENTIRMSVTKRGDPLVTKGGKNETSSNIRTIT